MYILFKTKSELGPTLYYVYLLGCSVRESSLLQPDFARRTFSPRSIIGLEFVIMLAALRSHWGESVSLRLLAASKS